MTQDVDRRKFLKQAAVAGAATGAVWVAPSVLGGSTAFAAGSCDQVLDWDTAGLAFSSSISKIFGSNTFTIAYTDPSSMVDTGGSYPSGIDGTFARSGAPKSYHIQLDGTTGSAGGYSSDGSSMTITMSFTSSVTNLDFSLLDIDSAGTPAYDGSNKPKGWVDRVKVEGSNGGTAVTGSATAGSAVTTNVAGKEFTGKTATANTGTADADVAFHFDGPLDKVVITYIRAGDVATQGIGVSNIAFHWCP